MNSIELRNNFHSLIDKIKNDALLMKFYEIMIKAKDNKEGELISCLTKEEYEELIISYQESKDESNLISHDEMKNKHSKWL